jgi:hypothetical protein
MNASQTGGYVSIRWRYCTPGEREVKYGIKLEHTYVYILRITRHFRVNVTDFETARIFEAISENVFAYSLSI